MDWIVKKASGLSSEEQAARGITGIPQDWPIELYPYTHDIPDLFEQMSDFELELLKANNQAYYDAWYYSLQPLPPQPGPQPVSLATLPPVTISGVDASTTEKTMKVSTTKLEGSSTLLVSPNLCDKTTWYEKSTRVLVEELTSSDYLTYSSAHTHWIDLTHGKVSYEDRISGYNPVVYVDGSAVTTGFAVDYVTGSVVFSVSQEGKAVTADYSYATVFSWSIYPSAGKILKMIGTFIKCTDDVSMVEGEVIDFQLLIGGNPYGYPTTYKSFDDFLKCCSDIKRIEKFGSMEHDVIQLDFDYITSKDLKYNQGASIEIKITGGNVPFNGTWSCVVANVISVNL